MSGFNYKIGFQIKGLNALNRVTNTLDKLDNSINRLTDKIDNVGAVSERTGRRSQRAFGGMTNSLNGFIARIGVATGVMRSLQTAADIEGFEKAIQFSSGDIIEGQRNIQFLNDTIDSLRLPIRQTTEGFQVLLGSMMGTKIPMETTRDLFTGISQAARVLNVPTHKVGNAFLAVGQMASKGIVSMEELRGQLGDALPGAAALAAKAMNMPLDKFNELVEDGKLLSEDFLPKFSVVLQEKFAGGVSDALNSASANFSAMNNALFRLSNVVGEELLPAVMPLLTDFIIPGVRWIGENIKVLTMLGIAFTSVRAAAFLYSTGMGIAALATGKSTIAFWGLNAALLANPITWVVGGLIALSAAAIYAWNNFDWFKKGLRGIWEVMKETYSIMDDMLIKPWVLLGKILYGVVTGDMDMIKSGLEDTLSSGIFAFRNAGERLGGAFQEGYHRTFRNFDPAVNIDSGNILAEQGIFGLNLGQWHGPTPTKYHALTGVLAGTPNDNSSINNSIDGTKTKEGITAITGGGKKTVNNNITIQRFFDDLVLYPQTVGEGMDEVGEMVTRKFLELTNSMNAAQ